MLRTPNCPNARNNGHLGEPTTRTQIKVSVIK